VPNLQLQADVSPASQRDQSISFDWWRWRYDMGYVDSGPVYLHLDMFLGEASGLSENL